MAHIYDITPFSLLDYPDELSCIVWFSGCNLRCVYCHNPDIVRRGSSGDKVEAEVISFLESRKGKLTAVVFSGGEATYCESLPELARKAHELGYKTKLDTNGSNPDVIQKLVDGGLLDYVALDYKCPTDRAKELLGSDKFMPAFYNSLDYLIKKANEGKVRFEARTTASPTLLPESDVNRIIRDLDARFYRGTYWVQNIQSTGEKTLGNIPDSKEQLDRTKLEKPQNFDVGYRNFLPL